LPECDDVHLVTIVPRGQAGGYTLSLPAEENDNLSKKALLGMITMALGGHAAEKVALDDIYTGSSSDLKRATELARRMVTQFGMSNLGTIYLASDQEVFVGMEFGQSREYSEQSAAAIDAEVKRIVDECYQRAQRILTENLDRLTAVAEALLERDTLTRREFEAVMRGETLPPQVEPTPEPKAATAEAPAASIPMPTEPSDPSENEPFVEPKE
ncbi:MAG: ATP-dependent zinc metalloprotease FtsH, partial [Eubacteriales bacterium]|nr:ATP-dependent zinc metalloprotease FtsH [Eubacteriales bacterium]